ncbi:MAG: hypothetical protein K2L38_01780 [Dysosmobacter sp.]|nr:hypothetical protein [Dysosmobacter sp.]
MSTPKAPKRPINPRVRANVYALAALYLAYLFYQIAKPYLTRDPYGPTAFQFALGLAVLGGGAAALGFLAWRMYKAPLPEEEEDPALPEESGGDEDGEA